MILQFSQILRILVLTFIAKALSKLLLPVNDASPREVIGRHLDRNAIAGQYPDKVHPHLAGYVSQHPVAVGQFHPEHCVRKGFLHDRLKSDRLLFRQNTFLKLSHILPWAPSGLSDRPL